MVDKSKSCRILRTKTKAITMYSNNEALLAANKLSELLPSMLRGIEPASASSYWASLTASKANATSVILGN
ncbi:unnamed protein product [Ceratitis capitata]|uniref:(Mediterranean fruit fly) hypothetical protein n=1 Tax=Ceratitis capitata TaxID=7213 RepID=A0A811U038_CERCA|nr:unnamed protein product [Ceratitis capitata]